MVFDVEGVVAPVFTPMNDAGSLHLEVVSIYMAHLKKLNINSIVGGTTGEAMSLSVEERKSVLEAWMHAARPLGTKVVAQIGGAPLPDVIELAKHAESLQVDAVMCLPELYFKPKAVDHLVDYLVTVSKAAPTRALIYYHFPMMSGVDATSKIPNFKGAKGDLEMADQVVEQLVNDQRIFIANHHIAPAVLMGHESSIAIVSNIFPELVQDIVHAVKSADCAKATLLQRKLNKLVHAIASQGDFVSSMKVAMELVTGIPVGPTRHPLIPLDQKQRILLKEALSCFDL